MIDVIWWSNHDDVHPREQWDTGLLLCVLDESRWAHGFDFDQWFGRASGGGPNEIAVFIVPARHHASPTDLAALNADLGAYLRVLVILVGDEEAIFPWREVSHPNARFWVQMPRPSVHSDMRDWAFFFGNGFRLHTTRHWPGANDPHHDWAFAGQVTHLRRKQAANGLRKASRRVPGELIETAGFTQGLERQEYLDLLADTKVAPCPSGPCSQDTFRLYEALEMGAVPIADNQTPTRSDNYWEFVYGHVPFPRIDDWDTVGGYIEYELEQWPRNANVCSAWWQQRKREMTLRLIRDLEAMGAERTLHWSAQVTIVVTTSPTPAESPSEVLARTIHSARAFLPHAPVIVACDGVRPEQAHLAHTYDRYVRQVSLTMVPNMLPVVSWPWQHQANMMKLALDHVHTPLVLFMEHDTPLTIDEPIKMETIVEMMRYGALDVLRFHHEAAVHPEHEHLMLDHATTSIMGVPLRRTVQWSQRPHIAGTDYYRRIMQANFPVSCRTMIEDKMHSVVQSNPGSHRIAIYHPEGNVKRSYHLDARGAEPKFEMKFR